MRKILIALIIVTSGCSPASYTTEKLDQNFIVIDKAVKDIAIVLQSHEDRLNEIRPIKKEVKK